MPMRTTRPPTLWTLCRALPAAALSELRDLASHEDRVELRRRLRVWLGRSLKRSDCLRLEGELLRLVVVNSTNEHDPPPAEIVRQLKMIAGLGGMETTARMPWRVEVAQSSTVGGGEGVFLRGTCEASTVLAVYPGVSYTTADLPHMAKGVLDGNRYTLFLRNGVIVDGRRDGKSREVSDAARHRDQHYAACQSQCIEDSPLAVGHKVNHPPRGVSPNVRVVPLDLGRNEHVALHWFLPVVHAHPPPADAPWKRTAVLIASRDLCDEELWLDYKLRKEHTTWPQWYTPCDAVGSSLPVDESSVEESALRPSAPSSLAGYYY